MPLFDTSQQPLANYNYEDIADGSGMLTFYGNHSMEDTTDNYLLSSQKIASQKAETYLGVTSGTFIKVMDLDFDNPPFNLPKNIIGTAKISIPYMADAPSGNSTEVYLIAKLRKWDGSSETELGSAQSETIIEDGTGPQIDRRQGLMTMTIPLTHFKKGETLRLTVEVWAKGTAGNTNVGIGHDPPGRISTNFPGTDGVSTIMKVNIPARLGI